MAAATEGISRTTGIDRLASGMTLAGGIMVGLGAKAIQTASQFQQMQMSLQRLTGSNKMFEDLKKYTFSTPYTTSIWADQARMLLGFGVAADQVIPTLKTLGDAVTGVYGVDPTKLSQLTYAYAEMAKGFANARHVKMFQTAGASPYDSIHKYLGLDENQIANIGKLHIPGKYVNAAIMKGIMDDPGKQDAQIKFMDTMAGQMSNLSDSWQQMMAGAGTGALEPIGKAINFLADGVKRLSDPSTSKSLGYMILFGGPAMLAAGPLVRAISLWKQMEGAKKLATIASNTERNAELSKLPVLQTETTAVETATSRWSALGDTLLGVATKAGTLYAAYAALQGVKDVYDVTKPGGADSLSFDAEFNTLRKDRKGAMLDFLKDPTGNIGIGLADIFQGKGTAKGSFDQMITSANAIVERSKDQKAAADFHRLLPSLRQTFQNWGQTPWSTVEDQVGRIHEVVNEARNYNPADSGLAAQQKAAEAANAATLAQYNAHRGDYLKTKTPKPSAAEDPLAQADAAEDRSETMMKIAGLRYKRTGAKADHDAYNAARKETLGLIDQEIAGLERHAAAIEHVAGKSKEWLTTEKKVQSLMEKHEELESDKLDKDKRSKLDKTEAQILGGGGLSEDEILKRAGIGRAFFAGMTKGKLPHNPLTDALKQVAKRPLIVNVKIGDRTWLQLKKEIVDDALEQQIRLMSTSGQNTLFGSH